MDCIIPDISLPDFDLDLGGMGGMMGAMGGLMVVFGGLAAGLASWMMGMMMSSVVYFIEFVFLMGIFFFLFSLVSAYFILKPYILTPPSFTGSKEHVI